ncbi:MAG: response regulator transcription factor [Paludibacteraceae bacterium]|nr:response regulator transcription factor [Candidatus Physcocola equi]MCQ2234310.1 response regulator transcription factor [Paludibacteraceae bacterium]
MIQKYHAHDPISDLISDDYRMLQVISRFNIALGVGDQTVQSVCLASGVDTPTFLAVVNYIKAGEKVYSVDLVDSVSVGQLLTYLVRSHTYFLQFRLPAIRRKLIEAIDCSSNQIAFLVLKFYDDYAAEVGRHMEYENEHVHPYVNLLLSGKLPQGNQFDKLIHQHQDNHGSIEKSGEELKNIIIKYYTSDSNPLILNDVLMDIYMMQEDLLMHCHLEDTLFAEAVRHLEEDVKENANNSHQEPDETDDKVSDGLSEREIDIIREIVKGLSNKEIADNLFISVNTVMTHRRNIARKLNIHSPSGLTIYALVNGIVSLEDVKIGKES